MADIAIIGGGINGSSIAYHLMASGKAGNVVVVEPDPTYEHAATPRSTGGVRRIFSIPECIAMSDYGHEVYGNFDALMAIDGQPPGSINFRRIGYTWMGSGPGQVETLVQNWKVHIANGVRVELLDRKGVKLRFPALNVDDIDAALFSPDDGFIDPYSALIGIRKKAIDLGAEYIKDRVVDFQRTDRRIQALVLESGKVLKADIVVNAANCWGIALCEALGMKIPVQPMRRLTFYFEVRQELGPLTSARHIGSNVSFRPEGKGFISGKTNYNEKFGFNWDVDYDWFNDHMWPDLAQRVTAFAELKVQSAWSCHYDQNTMDNNAIVGRWIGGCDNFYVCIGFSGHGLQHAPATGRAIKELLIDGGYQTLDLSRLSYQRVIDNKPLQDIGPYA
jgi:glycine/D-amino acid oxidase-like deaminating enzyme